MDIIITSPSLDPKQNVSGISSVTKFIIEHNMKHRYLHFELGKKDYEKGGIRRVVVLYRRYKAWKQLLTDNPKALIHYNFPLSRASLLRDPWFLFYALKKKRKIIVHIHGGLFLTASRIPSYLRLIMRLVFRQNIPFIVLSDVEKDILYNRFGANTVISLPNCIDLSDAKTFAEENHYYNEAKPLRIGYLGRIEPNKGMTELLFAGKRLKKENYPFQLVIAGKEQNEGVYLPQFKQCFLDSFRYVGLVSGNAKCEFLRSLDVFILPTYFEGLPMSLLECMSYGVTPVVTPVGSIPQVVKNMENGLYINDHDVDSIVNAIKQLNENRQLLRSLGKSARKTIFNQFDPQRYIERLNCIYEDLVI